MFKKVIQNILRLVNIAIFKKELPSNISIYFHDISLAEKNEIIEIIKFFKYLNYKFVPISKFNDEMNSKDKIISLSFDDGFTSWLDLLPIFERYQVKATFFMNTIQLTTDNLTEYSHRLGMTNFDQSTFIDIDGLRKIINKKHEIGSHTHSHFLTKKLSKENLTYEITKNLEILSSQQLSVRSFAIPYGMRRYIKKSQILYLKKYFDSICFGEPGMLFKHESSKIQRYPWSIDRTFKQNINNISTDTSIFNKVTKFSGIG